MSANKIERGLSLMRERERERARFFTGGYLKETGAKLFVVCRDCLRWRELTHAALPDELDVRSPEGRFRCTKCASSYVLIGVARGPDDPGPPGIPGMQAFRRRP